METREQVLNRICGDYTYSLEDKEKILSGSDIKHKIHIYLELLLSVRWYTLKSILSDTELKEILSPDIVNRLHIQSLRQNYTNARRILFG